MTSWQIVDCRFKIVDCGLGFASYGCAVIGHRAKGIEHREIQRSG